MSPLYDWSFDYSPIATINAPLDLVKAEFCMSMDLEGGTLLLQRKDRVHVHDLLPGEDDEPVQVLPDSFSFPLPRGPDIKNLVVKVMRCNFVIMIYDRRVRGDCFQTFFKVYQLDVRRFETSGESKFFSSDDTCRNMDHPFAIAKSFFILEHYRHIMVGAPFATGSKNVTVLFRYWFIADDYVQADKDEQSIDIGSGVKDFMVDFDEFDSYHVTITWSVKRSPTSASEQLWAGRRRLFGTSPQTIEKMFQAPADGSIHLLSMAGDKIKTVFFAMVDQPTNGTSLIYGRIATAYSRGYIHVWSLNGKNKCLASDVGLLEASFSIDVLWKCRDSSHFTVQNTNVYGRGITDQSELPHDVGSSVLLDYAQSDDYELAVFHRGYKIQLLKILQKRVQNRLRLQQ
jgi:hypothetical protein